jgi:undecaprenyl-diphosphatase
MSVFQAAILAIIEGITEFLPISSTGHMIIGSSVMGIASNEFVKLFTVCIQLGAILSVLVLYFKRFLRSVEFYVKLIIAFIPSAILGLLLNDYIEALMETPLGVAISLLVGGIFLLFVDKLFNKNEVDDADKISRLTALKIGFCQCISLIPGVSRSGATIVGGMSLKLTRKAAAEFSFFLAVPTMFAATAFKLYKHFKDAHGFTGEEIKLLAIGNVIAFLVALLAIKTFIGFLNKFGFKLFGWYRIVIGGLILMLLASGYNLQIID